MADPKMPPSPLTSAEEFSIYATELMAALVLGGFTAKQAFELLKTMVHATVLGQTLRGGK